MTARSWPQTAPDSKDWVRDAIEASGDLVYDWDLTADRIEWVGLASGFFGTGDELVPDSGRMLASHIHPEDLPQRLKALTEHFNQHAPYDCEYRLRLQSGEECWVHDRGAVKLGEGGDPERLIGTLRMINARKQHEARLERLASFDDLTGHFNKLRLRDSIDLCLKESYEANVTSAFLVIGVDNLSKVNNAFGYQAGDQVLIAIGQHLDHILRSSDTVGRIGADRFGVLLPRCSDIQMNRAAERILQAVREMSIPVDPARVHVTVSIGGLVFPNPEHMTAEDIVTRAETALRQAKRDGRDRFTLYQASQQQNLLHRRSQTIVTEVERAIAENRLCFAFQPVVDAVTHQPVSYECLIRLKSASGELVPAAAFVPVVEQLGLVRQMDRHVLELAAAELAIHPTVELAVNLSGLTAADPTWFRALKLLLQDRPEMARRLIFEITETTALQDVEETARFIQQLKDLGCRLSLDDFGAGYTSFRHLQALNFDIVKIDGSFIRNLRDNPEHQLFVRNLLGMADAFGLKTVAECVETGEDAGFLANEGVHYLQGYYFGRPSLERPWLAGSQPVATLPALKSGAKKAGAA
ncbi:GGDEF-domain containing protein [Hypericibacter terrae]|uniref:GGDEF-domain containing protein n=1 Tax=Hypericibacter terrae TaxID=2602015 RepID=A0A5J6MP81_9PROT|nr:bifunctional diguanylate cyclase/phosphodiesterase [Hypericibacter terrae]QEX19368.1 GGDEF-domain containing protein [Hypericibacter terrae]